MQHLALFPMTLDFYGEYPWNQCRYLKSDKYLIDCDFSHVWR